MPKERITLPSHLTDWIDRRLPDVGGISNVKLFRCYKIPFEWLARSNEKPSAVTICNRIYFQASLGSFDDPPPEMLAVLFHELTHVIQFKRHPVLHLPLYAWYLLRKGYWDSPMEIEAREAEAKLVDEYLRDYKG